MKNRATLTLMEQLVMILVFALAAVICLQVFVTASKKSRDSEDRDRAVIIAQNAAEVMKATGELPDAAEYDGLRLTARPVVTPIDGLAEAEVEVVRIEDGLSLVVLNVAWQEEDSDG